MGLLKVEGDFRWLPEGGELASDVHDDYIFSDDVAEIKDLGIVDSCPEFRDYLTREYQVGAGLVDLELEGTDISADMGLIAEARKRSMERLVGNGFVREFDASITALLEVGEEGIDPAIDGGLVELAIEVRRRSSGEYYEKILSTDKFIEKLGEIAYTLGAESIDLSRARAARLTGMASYTENDSILQDLKYYQVGVVINQNLANM